MTTITYDKYGDEFSLIIKGHAGYAEIGNDIVCSAISTLIQTLMEHMDNVADSYDTHIENGQAWLYGIGVLATLSYDTIMTGFNLIAEAYPDYLVLEKGVLCKENPF